ncbi:MAG: phospholipid carrier-dependent glycosyltransferase [Candidatus Zixiibacteriota bacterium]|nr:MAG: phospholipid carrier-dependent glycosyltransferase [candidate division Zixibacteria bacterium]
MRTRVNPITGTGAGGLLLIFLPALILRSIQLLQFPAFHFDEGFWNLGPKHAVLLGDPTAYGFGHMFLSPLHYLTTRLLYGLLSPSLVLSRGLAALFGAGTIILVFRLGDRFFGPRAALGAALLCAYNALMIVFSRTAVLEAEIAFYLLGTVVFWFHPNPRRVWISGLFLAAALLVKANALAVIPALVLSLWLYREAAPDWRVLRGRLAESPWAALGLGVGLAAAGYGLFYSLNPDLFLRTWQEHSTQRLDMVGESSNGFPIFGFVRYYGKHMPEIVILAGLGFLLGLRKRPGAVLFLALWYFFTFALVSVQHMRSPHYYYPVIAAMILLAAFALTEIFPAGGGRWRRLGWPVIVALFCLAQLWQFQPYYQEGRRENPILAGVSEWVKERTPADEPVVSIGRTMLLVPNPTIPVANYLQAWWEADLHPAQEPAMLPARYIILRCYDRAPPTPGNTWKVRYLNENYRRSVDEQGGFKVIVLERAPQSETQPPFTLEP